MVLGINGCSQNNKTTIIPQLKQSVIDKSFFKNDTIKIIIDEILVENNNPKNLCIELLDDSEQTLLIVDVIDSLDSCDNVRGIYKYNNSSLIFIDYSKEIDFENSIDLSQTLSLDSCNNYIRNDDIYIIDTERYHYKIDSKGNVFYPNGKNLEFKNKKIKLKLWY